MQYVETEGENPELYQPVISFGFLAGPPTDYAESNIKHGGKTLK